MCSASSDADGDPLSYTWTFSTMPAGSTASLSDPNSVNPSFVADVTGTYIVQLIVNDGEFDSIGDLVTITVSEAPDPSEELPGVSTSITKGAGVHCRFRYIDTGGHGNSRSLRSFATAEQQQFSVPFQRPDSYHRRRAVIPFTPAPMMAASCSSMDFGGR